MTHAWQRDSPSRRHSEPWELMTVRGLLYADTMNGTLEPDRPTKRGRPRKINRGRVKERRDDGGMEEERKPYPLRTRTLSVCEGETLDCRVLLTRLEEKRQEGREERGRGMKQRERGMKQKGRGLKERGRGMKQKGRGLKERGRGMGMKERGLKRSQDRGMCAKQRGMKGRERDMGRCVKGCVERSEDEQSCNYRVHGKTQPSKSRQKTASKAYNHPAPQPKHTQSLALCTSPVFEPRKRRLASLNAEAVNSLLLHKEEPHTSRLARKQQQQQPNGGPAKDADVSIEGHNTPREPKVLKSDICASPKKPKKAKLEFEDVDLLSLYTPTPRRQAGLTAAALLKLTSAPTGGKRRAKTDIKQVSDSKQECGARKGKQPHSRLTKQKLKLHSQSQPRLTPTPRCCSLCQRGSLHPEAQWEGAPRGGQGGFIRPGFQCRSMLGVGYPRKPVKEEQAEAEVTPCYCCSQERSVEYCHRLALFLDQNSYQGEEPEGHALSKGEYLPSPHTLGHPHPALTIGPHPYPCFSGYYVHFSHHETPSSPPMSASPMPYPASSVPPITLCPGEVQRPKLRPPQTSPHPSGMIPHPVFCSSVGPCYGEPCRISGYAYRAVPTITNRGCYSAGCTSCSHNIKMEDYSSLDDRGPPSIPAPPARTRPLSGCPVPSVPTSAQSVPHLQTPLSDPSQPQVPLQVARECPQSAKPPSGSRSGSGVRGSSVCPPHVKDQPLQLGRQGGITSSAAKQQRISRHRATNGWLPVGVPFEKEVFTVGEESLVLRKCFEGVQRDSEVIRVRDTVLLRSGPRKKSLPYVAKVSAFWEEPESGEMMMSLFWYYRPEHTQGGRNTSTHCENEIFASRHQDENSVACIEDRCYVLTLAQYCRFCALVKRRGAGLPDSAPPLVPPSVEYAPPAHRCVPADVDPDMVFVCRHVYDFRYGRILKNLQ